MFQWLKNNPNCNIKTRFYRGISYFCYMYRKLFLLLLPFVFIYACSKEGDTYSPQVSISSPFENQLFAVDDIINVKANVCDDRKLEYVSVKLLNDDMTPVSASQTVYPENNCTDINLDLNFENVLLPTGTYYVLVSASDGVNVANEFRKISIKGLDKKLKFVLVLTKNDGTVTINKIDSLNNVTQVKTVTTDYCGAAVSSDAQQFYLAGRYTGDVSVFSMYDWQPQWNVPIIVNPPFPYFEAIDVYNSYLYVSYREGMFHIYNESGNIVASHVIENGEYPQVFLPVKNYLVTYEVSPGSSQKHLMAYFVPSFSTYKKIPVTYEILKIFPMSEDECLLFCNDGDQSVIKLFSLVTGSVTDMYYFTSGLFTDVTQMESTQFLFSSETAIWHFSYDYKGFSLWIDAQNPQNLVFDETEGCYYFSENYLNLVKKRFWPSETIGLYSFQDTIIDILSVYNRD
mgnify:CR=1 FL=1